MNENHDDLPPWVFRPASEASEDDKDAFVLSIVSKTLDGVRAMEMALTRDPAWAMVTGGYVSRREARCSHVCRV